MENEKNRPEPEKAVEKTPEKAPSGPVRLAVAYPRDRFVMGDHTVTREPKEFDRATAERLKTAAAQAGVTLKEVKA